MSHDISQANSSNKTAISNQVHVSVGDADVVGARVGAPVVGAVEDGLKLGEESPKASSTEPRLTGLKMSHFRCSRTPPLGRSNLRTMSHCSSLDILSHPCHIS